jgi:hypothetical protein
MNDHEPLRKLAENLLTPEELVDDLTESWRMPADSFAGIFCDTMGDVTVAWGRGYGALQAGKPHDAPNTAEHGQQGFETLDEARAYAAEVASCHETE